MASTYVNDLRLEEITTGEQAGTWGDTTNRNLELIAEAFGFGTEALSDASTETITLFDTAIAAGSTAGIGTTVFTVNKRTDTASGYTVAIGDSFTVGAALTDVAIVGVGTTVNEITIGTAHTSPMEIVPGTGVTFTRTGSATTIYSMVNGNILVIAGVSSAPS